jgi:hypothetical protein
MTAPASSALPAPPKVWGLPWWNASRFHGRHAPRWRNFQLTETQSGLVCLTRYQAEMIDELAFGVDPSSQSVDRLLASFGMSRTRRRQCIATWKREGLLGTSPNPERSAP